MSAYTLTAESLTLSVFRTKGRIFRASDLSRVKKLPLNELELPANSLLHYAGEDINDNGPQSSDPFIALQKKLVFVKHITDYKTKEDIRLKTGISLKALISDYHRKNKKTRLLAPDSKIPGDTNTLVAYNYGLLDLLIVPLRSINYWYTRWKALNDTIVYNIKEVAINENRQQFLRVDLPEKLLSFTQLNNLVLFGSHHNRPPNDRGNIFIYELWQWIIDPIKEDGTFTPLTELAEKNLLDKVDIVFVDKGFYFSMNLGMFFRARKPNKKELAEKQNWNMWAKENTRVDAQKLLRWFFLSIAILKGFDTVEITVEEVVESTATVSDDESRFKTAKEIEAEEKEIDTRINTLDKIVELSQQKGSESVEGDSSKSLRSMIHAPAPDFIEEIKEEAAKNGTITAAELRKIDKALEKSKSIVAPDGRPIMEYVKRIPGEEKLTEHEFPDKKIIFDKSALKSTLVNLNSDYIEKRLKKDICEAIMSFNDSGVIIHNLEITENKTLTETSMTITIQLGEIGGSISTVHLKVQNPGVDGTFLANGTRYQMRSQIAEDPIRKVDSDEVILTSYYGKTSITRNNKKVNDLNTWLGNRVVAAALDDENPKIHGIKATVAFDNNLKAPRMYGILGKRISDINIDNYALKFSFKEMMKDEGAKKLQESYSANSINNIVCGTFKNGYVVLDENNYFYEATTGGELKKIGDIYSLLNIDQSTAPIEYAEVNVYSKAIPVGVVLAYKMGLTNLLNESGVKYRIDYSGSKPTMDSSEFAIRFKDCALIFDRNDSEIALLFGGFNEFREAISGYSRAEFDEKSVYYNVLESKYISAKHLDEIDNQWMRFIDPITRGKLIELKEPTTYRGLLLRSVELLCNEDYPDKTSVANSRVRGYDRIPGHIYTILSRAVRKQIRKNGKKTVDIPPYAVWQHIATDPAVIITSEINPLEHIRGRGMITFAGHGGRSERTMVSDTREFHGATAIGLFSEGTTDSGNVGVNNVMPANPKIKTIYGTIGPENPAKEKKYSSILTTNALVTPGIWHDDSKRVAFKQIHDSHTRPCSNYKANMWRTGYESIVADYCDDSKFAVVAKKPGKVTKVTDHFVTIQYDDGTVESYKCGRQFGVSAGTIIPMPTVSELKEGQKIKVGTPIVYNVDFFEKDPFNVDGGLVLKFGIPTIVRFVDSRATIEDSSAISKRLSEKLAIEVTHKRTVIVNFSDEIYDLVDIGQMVHQEDAICKLIDSSVAQLIDNESEVEDTLDTLDRKTPRCKYGGRIDDVEIFYNGEKDDMTESLRKLVNRTDAVIAKKNPEGKQFSGYSGDNFRVDGNQLGINTAVIVVKITDIEPMSSSDKLVFGTQLKSTVTRVMTEEIKTEDGHIVDATFGTKSVENRLVYGVYLQLTLCMTLWYISNAFINECLE